MRVPHASPSPYPDANSYRALANNRPVFAGVAELGAKLLREGSLDSRVREAVILAVVSSLGCGYEIHYHQRGALTVGLTDFEVQAAISGDVNSLPNDLATALRYSDAFAARQVDDDIWAETLKYYSAAEIIEIGVLTGYYTMIACSIAALEVELDEV